MAGISRRQVLSTSGLALTGALLPGKTAAAKQQSSQRSPSPVLSADLCNYFADQTIQTTVKLANGSATASDLRHAASHIRLLANHLKSCNFDVGLSKLIAANPGLAVNQTDKSAFQQAYSMATKYDSSISESLFIPPDISPADMQVSLKRLETVGIAELLQDLADHVSANAAIYTHSSVVPSSSIKTKASPVMSAGIYHPGAAHFKRACSPKNSLKKICSDIGDVNDWPTFVFWVLVWGCSPIDPFFYVICPVVVAGASITGVIFALTFVCKLIA